MGLSAQCVQTAHTPTHHPVPTHGCRFPSQSNVAQSHPPRQLLHVVAHHESNVAKHFPKSEETQLGHMRGQRQGVRSMQPTSPSDTDITTPHNAANDILQRIINVHDSLYTDQTVRFPFVSSLGNRYVMILHHVDSNSTWCEAFKNNSNGELILAC